MEKIRLLTVDDSNLMNKILRLFTDQHEHIDHVAHAFDAHEARKMIKLHKPDIITLDVEMPGMNGLEFLDRLMNVHPMPVIMFSSHTAEGTEITLKALELGAIDFLQKPNDGLERALSYLNSTLLKKLENSKNIKPISPRETQANMQRSNINSSSSTSNLEFSKDQSSKEIIAIGASTGGVSAIRSVLSGLPGNLPPIVMTQHMPDGYTERFAERLDRDCKMTALQAEEGMTLEYGHAYLAPGTHHMLIDKPVGGKYTVHLDNGPIVSGHRPSVDVLFNSLANSVPRGKLIATMLTGMGRDGAEGMLKLKENSHMTFAQNKETCVVYGMPKAAVEIGAVCHELPLDCIPNAIMDALCDLKCPSRRRA